MSSVDNRVVSMKFDNADFANKVSGTQSMLQKLKDSLNFSSQKQGISDLAETGRRFNLSGMGSAVDGISAKFLGLATVGITALANLTNRAVDAGIKIAKSLTLDPVLQGFQEYELNMNSIQTILANTKSKGSTLEDVNKALDELNTYADQTIYNFAEMSKNIGTFTAAGVDLDTSVSSIKGIANLAAISGSNSQQASTAMYQLSQAIAQGSVKLMDWNSVVNAGMGGEVFQKALFESGKAMGTLNDVPIDQTFEQWTAAGNSFRESLQDGWITSEVLTNTLKGFTGDLTEAQVMSMGYTKEQAKGIMEMGAIGREAATKVKTFTQLIDTLKEGVGSGWATTFRTIVGDFEEARALWSGMGVFFGGIADNFAEGRNKLLEGWKELGGRDILIGGFMKGVDALRTAIEPIRGAFRDIFPKQTAQGLVALTQRFSDFMGKLKMGEGTIATVRSIFRGLFAAIEIGWNVFKGFAGVVGTLLGSLSGVGSGGLKFLANFGDTLTGLNQKLVAGGGLAEFFDNVSKKINKFFESVKDSPILDKFVSVLERVKTALSSLFDGKFEGAVKSVNTRTGEVVERFSFLETVAKKLKSVFSSLGSSFSKVGAFMKEAIAEITDALGGIWERIAEQMVPGDFDKILNIANVGLLGGIVLLLKKFINDGVSIDLGGGLFEGMKDSFEALTGQLTAMQTNVKADTLQKIAIAIGILTASVLVLSLIDSAALTKALTAMAIGFGQLIASMALLTSLGVGVKLPILTASLIMVAGAIVILGIAVKMLAGLNWDELTKGLVGVGALLAMVTASAVILSKNTKGLSGVGLQMIGLAIAIGILSYSVKSFAEMDWEAMKQGLIGVAASLGALTLAMRAMPELSISDGLAIIGMAAGLIIMAEAVKKFGELDIKTLRQGLIGVAVALGTIVLAMNLMPPTLPATALGLIMVAGALMLITDSLLKLGDMELGNMIQAIAGMAAVLLILAVATNAMTGALAGAAAMVIVSGALWVLSGVLIALSKLSLGQLGIGLLAIAGVLGVLGLMASVLTPLIPAMLGLGVALVILGAGFALFGAGAWLAASAFAAVANAGETGITVLLNVIEALITAIPGLLSAIIVGIVEGVTKIAESAPALVRAIVAIVGELLDGLTTLVPKLAVFIDTLIENMLTLLEEKGPLIITAGFEFLMDFLRGLENNIEEITTTVSNIIIKFLNRFSEKMPDIMEAGSNLLNVFLLAIAMNLGKVITSGATIVVKLIEGVGKNLNRVVRAGADMIISFIRGVGQQAGRVVTEGVNTVIRFIQGLGQNAVRLANAAGQVVLDFIRGLTNAVNRYAPEIRSAGLDLALALVDGFTGGLASKAKGMVDKAIAPFKSAIDGIKGVFDSNSPSKVMIRLAKDVIKGFVIGMDSDSDKAVNSVVDMGNGIKSAFTKMLDSVSGTLDGMGAINPTITPVLDLSYVKSEAGKLNSMLTVPDIVGSFSRDQANALAAISAAQTEVSVVAEATTTPSEVKFEQNNYSPEALSVNDIYRNTRSQIELAKEELGV